MRKLHRVREQIDQDLHQPIRVSRDLGGGRRNLQRDLLLRGVAAHGFERAIQHR